MGRHQLMGKENRYLRARFGPRKENGQQKQAISVLSSNIQNVKKLQPLNPVKKVIFYAVFGSGTRFIFQFYSKATLAGAPFPFPLVLLPSQESNSQFTQPNELSKDPLKVQVSFIFYSVYCYSSFLFILYRIQVVCKLMILTTKNPK